MLHLLLRLKQADFAGVSKGSEFLVNSKTPISRLNPECSYNCVVGCQACINICPVEAIRFPSKEELRATMRRLREEMQAPPPERVGGFSPRA